VIHAHFAGSISDRGDDGFDHFTEIAERRRATRLRPGRSWLDVPGGVADAGRGGADMTDEGMTQLPPTPDGDAAERSTELVVPPRRPVVRPARAGLVVRFRGQLAELRQNPAAMVAVSAAATVGSALLGAGLRRTLLATPRSPTGKPASVAVGGYVVHEVHVIHHVVHHVIAPRVD